MNFQKIKKKFAVFMGDVEGAGTFTPHSSYIQKPLTIRVKIPRLFSPIHEQKLLKSFSNASPTIIFHFEPP